MAATQDTTANGIPPSDELVAVLHAGWGRRILVPLGYALFGALATALVHGAQWRSWERYTIAVPAILGLAHTLVTWLRKAVIRRSGVEIRSVLGVARVPFAELLEFTYDARSYRFYLFIPMGRRARLTLRSKRARALFHAGFARFDAYLPIVVDLAVAATVSRMKHELDGGGKALFGRRISVDAGGVYVKGVVFGEKRASVEELQVKVEDGEFHLATPAEKLGTFEVRNTPNLLALPQLLEELTVTRGRPRPAALQAALGWR